MIRFAISDRMSLAGSEVERRRQLVRLARRWRLEDVGYVLLREPDLGGAELMDLALEIRHALGRPYSHTRLLLHSDGATAARIAADGVHFPASVPLPNAVLETRRHFKLCKRDEPVLSTSCHTLAEVERARDLAVHFALVGPIFEKRVRGEVVADGLGLGFLRQAVKLHPVGVVALGGVGRANMVDCAAAGAIGVAGIRLFGNG